MIGIDWGTSSFRAYRMSRDGTILEKREAALGILSVAPGTFPQVLAAQIGGWDDATVMMSGMVGSRQGWLEAPYVQCPAGAKSLAAHIAPVAWLGRRAWIVPGLSCVDEAGVPDVMRGEETQLLGVLDGLGDDCLVCLPGTHSKWVRIRGARIASFRTYFTGELFAVLKAHSLLGRMMEEDSGDERAFADGVDRSADEGGLLNHLFGVRTRGLFGELGGAQAASYLSGLLIGHELRSAPDGERIHFLGAPALVERYARAAALLGKESTLLDPEAAPRGLFMLAREIGAP